MKISVIAASGRSGQAFVKEALAAGHLVKAGVHKHDPFTKQPNLRVMQCDATDIEQVTKLVDKSDAVVSLIGHVKGSDEFVQTNATKTVLRAMEVAGVKRLVSLTGVSVWVPGDRFHWVMNTLNDIAAEVGVKRIEDSLHHVELIEKSSTDWTIVRVALLTNGKPRKYRLKSHGIVKIPTSRRGVARAILKTLEQKTFIHEYPVVSW